MVLLKNDGVLPLNRDKLKSLYMTGPLAMSPEALLGNYHGLGPHMVTYIEGITAVTGLEIKTEFRHGCLLAETKKIPIDWATFEAKQFDVTIAFMGLNILMEGEEGDAIATGDYGDRPDIGLPKGQHDYLMGLLEMGKPIIIVVSGGSPIDLSPYVDKAAAIVYSWYPGEQGGTALAELLFGQADFSGKLPLSFPKSLSDLPAFEDYAMEGRTYRYAKAEPLFPFGFGLSYRPLKVQSASAGASQVKAGESLTVKALVNNPHAKASEEVVQFYVHKEVTGQRSAIWELAGFQRVSLKAGQSKEISFKLDAESMTVVGQDGKRLYAPGKLQLRIGTSQPDARSAALGVAPPVGIEIKMV